MYELFVDIASGLFMISINVYNRCDVTKEMTSMLQLYTGNDVTITKNWK